MTEAQTRHMEEYFARIFEFMGIPYPYNRPVSRWEGGCSDKILSISDPHEPYGLEAVYRECEANNKDAALLVVPGDLGDYYSKSRFRKTKYVSFRDE